MSKQKDARNRTCDDDVDGLRSGRDNTHADTMSDADAAPARAAGAAAAAATAAAAGAKDWRAIVARVFALALQWLEQVTTAPTPRACRA